MESKIEGIWKNFEFKMIKEESDIQRVLEHLKNNFYRDEPMNKMVGESEIKNNEINAIVRLFIEDNMSFYVEEISTKKIAGARIMGIHDKSFDLSQFSFESPEHKIILPFIINIEKNVDIFTKFKHIGDSYCDLLMASTDREYRGQGLATEMYNRTLKIARDKGFKLAKSIFTSHITRKVVSKMGFKEIHRAYYKDHVNENGDQLFPNPDPEAFAAVMILEL